MAEPGGGTTPSETDWDRLTGIQQVATELGISTRTLRFYEDKGLIEPRRVGTMRIYTRREVGRMQLILRGKRLGFTLRDIQTFLDLYDADPQPTGYASVSTSSSSTASRSTRRSPNYARSSARRSRA